MNIPGWSIGSENRSTQRYSEELSRIFEAQQLDMHFSDFKCLGLQYENTPDIIVKSTQGQLKIGELKAPWIKSHKPALVHESEDALRIHSTYSVHATFEMRVRALYHV